MNSIKIKIKNNSLFDLDNISIFDLLDNQPNGVYVSSDGYGVNSLKRMINSIPFYETKIKIKGIIIDTLEKYKLKNLTIIKKDLMFSFINSFAWGSKPEQMPTNNYLYKYNVLPNQDSVVFNSGTDILIDKIKKGETITITLFFNYEQ